MIPWLLTFWGWNNLKKKTLKNTAKPLPSGRHESRFEKWLNTEWSENTGTRWWGPAELCSTPSGQTDWAVSPYDKSIKKTNLSWSMNPGLPIMVPSRTLTMERATNGTSELHSFGHSPGTAVWWKTPLLSTPVMQLQFVYIWIWKGKMDSKGHIVLNGLIVFHKWERNQTWFIM